MSCGCVSYRCGDQQSAGLWLLRLVAAELGNHSTITHAESSMNKKKKEQRTTFLHRVNSELTAYQDKWCVEVGGEELMIMMRILNIPMSSQAVPFIIVLSRKSALL